MSKSKGWTKDLATALLQTQTRGRKRKNTSIVDMAEATRFLYEHMNHSFSKVAKEIGISTEMTREFYDISTLPREVKRLITRRAILIDAARRLVRLPDENRQIEVARAIAGLTSHDQRAIIEYAVNNHKMSAEKCKERVLGSKNIRLDIETLVIPFSKDEFDALNRVAKKKGMGVVDFSKAILLSQFKGTQR